GFHLYGMKFFSPRHRFLCVLTAAAMLLGLGAASAQVNPASYPLRDENGLAAQAATSPADDAVLALAPEELSLLFPASVRLVKLTLRDEKRGWIDINFRYNPSPRRDYVWQLPELPEAVYYTAEWAILSARERLIRGSFSFAFGPNAQAPSIIREAEELFLRQRAGTDPDIRYVAPPPTRIIINQDPRPFDPPFTINLDEDNPC
ncbi:MAG: copper resistance protein CopC, partial [Gammaproteobacteria bacterium]|nr:copper resistance protein CopC [Gammaproteobacteria bacterium]MCY4297377.1 copper resistance protein CopC [Gammaproteobacteria bacterium]